MQLIAQRLADDAQTGNSSGIGREYGESKQAGSGLTQAPAAKAEQGTSSGIAISVRESCAGGQGTPVKSPKVRKGWLRRACA